MDNYQAKKLSTIQLIYFIKLSHNFNLNFFVQPSMYN